MDKKNGKYGYLLLGLAAILINVLSLLTITAMQTAYPKPVVAQETSNSVSYTQFITSGEVKDLGVKGAVLIDGGTGYVCSGFNEHKPLHPASITKLMTAYIVLEKVHRGELAWQDPVPASSQPTDPEGTRINLRKGEVLPLSDMFRAMLVASANDAAVALAEKIAGSEGAFVKLMNAKAVELGLKETHFMNATGLPMHNVYDGYHYMSAYDIAMLANQLIKQYPEILETSGLASTTVRYGSYPIHSTNQLLGYFAGMDGLKTGYTDRAGYCLVGTAQRNNTRLISVVLGAKTPTVRNNSTVKLLTYGFNNYQKVDAININGVAQKFSSPALMVNGTVLVPLRDFAQALGSKVEFDQGLQQIKVLGDIGEVVALLNIGSRNAVCGTDMVELAQPVLPVEGKVMVPVRFLSQALGTEVQWDQNRRTIEVISIPILY